MPVKRGADELHARVDWGQAQAAFAYYHEFDSQTGQATLIVGILGYDSLGWLCVLPVDSETTVIRAGALSEASSGSEDRQSQQFPRHFSPRTNGFANACKKA
ncbi:MAG: hypothetical protein GY875_01485 [Gammaproteobacteria bacterium]|nr:hypothetical protein [Gammaproteobacteria bacterium]